MNAERYQRVKELFFAVCAEPVSARETFLDRACAGDATLRKAVDELLSNDQNPVNLTAMKLMRPHLEQLAAGPSTDPTTEHTALPVRIGGFRILDTLGVGGMGVVYRAQQDHPQRMVALKIVSPGQTNAAALHRFEMEAQMLARLKHSGIAHIYEAGAGDWGAGLQPFIAMELVNGRPLIQYVEQTGLDTRRRLELFLQICDAIEHAHRRGIIHRDLKPANILLDESTTPVQPKVLDFGVARALDADLQRTTFRTSANQIIGTVAYMSPEQVAGDPHEVDTRSDVYSLGVVLFELLSSRLPFELSGRSVAEAVHIITHDQPATLATTNRSFRGDLNTIVSRAMATDKTRRYQSVGDLARDIRHHLNDEPIEARRDSALYVLRKTLRRYRVPVAALAMIMAVVVVSAVVAWSLYVGQQRATQEARDARQEVEDRLHESLVLQARASRKTGMFDSREAALDALARAAQIKATLEVRNEAIAAMALPGLKPVPTALPAQTVRAVDANAEMCVLLNEDLSEAVYRVSDGSVITRIPPPRVLPTDSSPIELLQLCRGYFARAYDVAEQPRRLEVWRIPEADLWMEFVDLPDRSKHRISPDERVIAVPRQDQSIRLFDLQTRQEIRRIDFDGQGGYVQFDPTGRWLARYHDNNSLTEIHDLQSHTMTHAFADNHIGWALEWARDGSMMAGADGLRIQLWDVAHQRPAGTLEGHSDVIVRLQFSPDGMMLTSYSWDGEGILWDVRRRQPLVRFRASIMGWPADGGPLIGNGSRDGFPMAFEIQGGQEYSFMAALDADDPKAVCPIVVFDPLGRFIFTGSASTRSLRVFDVHTLREIGSAAVGVITEMCIDDSGRWLVTGDEHGTRLWPISPGQESLHIGPPRVINSDAWGHYIEISHDGRLVVCALNRDDSELLLVDREQPASARKIPLSLTAISPRFSNHDRWLAIGNWHGQGVELWDVESGQRFGDLNTSGGTYAQFSPDDRFLATSDRTEICLWDTRTWHRTACVPSPQSGAMIFSPDGSIIATELITKQVRLMDAHTLVELAVLQAPDGLQPRLTAFSRDGSMLAFSAINSHLAHVWNLRAVRERLASMGLDWNLPPYPSAPTFVDSQPLQCEIQLEPKSSAKESSDPGLQ